MQIGAVQFGTKRGTLFIKKPGSWVEPGFVYSYVNQSNTNHKNKCTRSATVERDDGVRQLFSWKSWRKVKNAVGQIKTKCITVCQDALVKNIRF